MQIDPKLQKQLDRVHAATSKIGKGLEKKRHYFADNFFSIKYFSLKYFK